MTLSELVAQVEKNIGRDDKTDDIPTYINLGLQRIFTDHQSFNAWKKTSYSTVNPSNPDVNPRFIILPTELAQLKDVKLRGSDKEIERVTREEYDEIANYYEDPEYGVPKYYTAWGNNLEVYPIPKEEVTYYIRWIRKPVELIEDTDEPVLPYDELIIASATTIAYTRLEQVEQSRNHYNIYQSLLEKAIRTEARRYDDADYRLEGYKNSGRNTRQRQIQDQLW